MKHFFVVKVGRVTDPGAIRCDRKTPLGNPYHISQFKSRDDVCDQYDHYLKKAIADNNSDILNYLAFLYRHAAEHRTITLGCHCFPKRCHTESIRNFLLSDSAYTTLFKE